MYNDSLQVICGEKVMMVYRGLKKNVLLRLISSVVTELQ